MPILTHRFDKALGYASEVHRMQIRKGTDIPYLSHLMGVASLVLEYGGDEDQAIAGLLHDAAEDAGGDRRLQHIRLEFGDDVAAIVADCTDSWVEPKPAWRPRKEAYIAGMASKADRSLLVSLADKTHNARAIVADLNMIGDELWDRFTASKTETIWYYCSMADIFSARLGSIAHELGRCVQSMDNQSDNQLR